MSSLRSGERPANAPDEEPQRRPNARLSRRVRRRRTLVVVAAVLVVLIAPVAWSLGGALTRPGSDTTAERVAEWARDHHAGALVTWLERKTYQKPKVGGAPPASSPLEASGATAASSVALHGLPAPVSVVASPALPGEGRWRVLDTLHGHPALAVAYERPDATHTSYTSMVAWINPLELRAVWHPGATEPGGSHWPAKDVLAGSDRHRLVAAFNSAFRLKDSHGGFYAGGRTLKKLRTGAASLVLDKQGKIAVGAWGTDVSMTPDVQTVRQNLSLLVDGGQLVPGIQTNTGNRWGATIGNRYYVWRSGIGVTATGAAVYVAGDRLSALTLAQLLQRAGAVRAMELDINPDWTSFIEYRSPQGGTIERNALPDMKRPASRYDSTSSRDFVALYLR
jgi:hypothetical protein